MEYDVPEKYYFHESVLLKETISQILNDPDGVYVDCTVGGGGHAAALAEKLNKNAFLIGIDQDEDALAAAKRRLSGANCRTVLIKANFRALIDVLDKLSVKKINGAMFDLGVSSWQLDNPERGFSYMRDGPLDMRMDKNAELTAQTIINCWPEQKLSYIIKAYGEERWAARIAEFIAKERAAKQFATTLELAETIKRAIPKSARRDGPHPAKRTFQAIRIALNAELNVLAAALEAAIDRLDARGRLAVITFHSLEDRIAKRTIAQFARDCVCPPGLPVCACGHRASLKDVVSVKPGREETSENPRARSARLRGATKI
ncbi:MAG: 16S rRNA (cytosine(1402)-N(4))-methyltransferase RsmH [Acidaminococcales bacterium]|nr:16S rRNA (cytosine(1402)-N(4))-methyltransferase RsmH [Acidaminococcales bacterium]